MKIIAQKARGILANRAVGYVKPIAVIDPEGYKPASSEMFKNNGEVFIYGGYSYLDENNTSEDLFELDNIAHNPEKYDPNSGNSCYYSGNSSSYRKISNTEFVKIIDGDYDGKSFHINNLSELGDGEPFFILNGTFLYGPINYDFTTERVVGISLTYFDSDFIYDLYESGDYQEFIFKFQLQDILSLIVGSYVINIEQLLDNTYCDIIYIGTKEATIEWAKATFKHQLNSDQSDLLSQLKNKSFPNLSVKSERLRFERFKEFLDETNIWVNSELPKFLNQYLESEQGNAYKEKFLKDNEHSFFNQYREKELREIDGSIDTKRAALREIEEQISLSQASIDSQNNKIFENLTQDEKSNLETIIKDNDKRTLLLSYYNENKKIEELTKQVHEREGALNYINGNIEKYKEQEKELNSTIENLKKVITEVKTDFFNNEGFARRLIETKLYTDLLNNIDPSEISTETSTPILPSKLNIYEGEMTGIDFVTEITNRLKILNRNFEYNDVANYLISIHQNFLTIFSGHPGVGKTSLIQRLAMALGCYNNNRYLSVAVQRGWTSSKDLIGFYNPLTKKFQNSKTGVYQFLLQSEIDYKGNTDVPNIILLDEANLSPIEHYWAEFSSKSDDDYVKEVSLENKNISLSRGLRFIGTINNDHTTETLSDRLISRVPIIQLPYLEYVSNSSEDLDQQFSTFPLSRLEEFMVEKDSFKGDLKNKFEQILKILKDPDRNFGRPIIVSHRKQKAVEQYCNVAVSLMKDNKFIALDYAVSQHILPLINGRGDGFRKRLNSLSEKLSNLPISIRILENIILSGDESYKNYKFFCS